MKLWCSLGDREREGREGEVATAGEEDRARMKDMVTVRAISLKKVGACLASYNTQVRAKCTLNNYIHVHVHSSTQLP